MFDLYEYECVEFTFPGLSLELSAASKENVQQRWICVRFWCNFSIVIGIRSESSALSYNLFYLT